MRLFNQDAAQSQMSFMVSQAAYLETQVYEIKYPDIQYPRVIPVEVIPDEWAKAIAFFSLDKVGQAKWVHHMADDFPFADVVRNQYQVPVEMASVGYYYTVEEVAQAQKYNLNLQAERVAAAQRAAEEFLDRVAFFGDTTKNWTGLVNDANVTAGTATADGTGSSALWSTKTGDQIVRDINQILTAVYTGSATVETADTLLLPPANFTLAATTRLTNTTVSALGWVQEYNAYTALTGNELTIAPIRGLETAGSGGTARMVAYRRDPQICKFHIPMPHKFLTVMQVTPLRFDVPGIFRTGGVEIRRPGSMRYLDGI